MNKSELVKNVSKKCNTSSVVVELVLDAFMDEISTSLCREEKVVIKNFGKFSLNHFPERRYRNPHNGAWETMKATKRIAFSASEHFVEHVRTVIKKNASQPASQAQSIESELD